MMNKYWSRFLFWVLFVSITNADLAHRWENELSQPDCCAVTDDERLLFSSKQAVLVTGYLVEAIGLISEYYSDNASVLEYEFSIKSAVVTPPSTQSQQLSADQLANKILELYETNGHKPVILIGHSKGGAESLLMALQHPEFVHNGVLDRVILIQAAVNGSPIADNFVDSKVLSPFVKKLHGLQSLGTQATREQFEENIQRLKSVDSIAYSKLSSKTFFVRSYKKHNDMTKILLATHLELKRVGGDNDGLLLTSNQWVPDFGQDLGVLYADHADLTVTKPLSTEEPLFRFAFTRALLREVYGIEKTCCVN